MTAATHILLPQPLGSNDSPVQKIRCPIHGFIHYSANERQIIDHPAFRRLRAIRQLALTEFIYPGATHTRFEHSLGVMELATRAFDSLCLRYGEQLKEHFQRYPYFHDRPIDRARQLLRIAALLHDAGHAPFSHAAESVIQKDGKHEELSIQLVESDEVTGGFLGLRTFLEQTWGEGTSENVAALIKKDYPPHLAVLKQLISGEIDADRMDYLLRDSHHCGVDYGRFDHRRLIECLAITFDESGLPQTALDEGGLNSYEGLILARFQMNVQVYYHRVRRIYDYYLREYFKAIGPTAFPTPSDVLRGNDFTMLTKIQKDARDPTAVGYPFARLIHEREHHREVFAYGTLEWNAEGAEKERMLLKKFDTLKQEFPENDLIFDRCEETKGIKVHKLQQRGDQQSEEQAPERTMKLLRKGGGEEVLGFASLILGKVPREFKLPRIFAVVKNQPVLRNQIEARAHEIYEGI